MVTASAGGRNRVRANYGAGLAVAVVRVLPVVAAVALLVRAAVVVVLIVVAVVVVVVPAGGPADRRRPGRWDRIRGQRGTRWGEHGRCRCRSGRRGRRGDPVRRRRGGGRRGGRRCRCGSRSRSRGRGGSRSRGGGRSRRGGRSRSRSRSRSGGGSRYGRGGLVRLHGRRGAADDSGHGHRLGDEHRRALCHRPDGHARCDGPGLRCPHDDSRPAHRRSEPRGRRQRPWRPRRDLCELRLEHLPPEVGARRRSDHEQDGLRPGEPERHRPPAFEATRFFPSAFAR